MKKHTGSRPTATPVTASSEGREFELQLYIVDETPRCLAALKTITRICEEQKQNKIDIEVIDLLRQPEAARRDGIVAIPTLARKNAPNQKRLVGDLSDTQRVMEWLAGTPPGNRLERPIR